jgi:hypothetical protein
MDLSEDKNKQDSSYTHNDVQPDKDSPSLNDSQSNPSVADSQPEISHSFSPAQSYVPQPAPNNLSPPPAYSAPMIGNPSAQPTTPQNQADNHNTNALTIIIQWLTYAFWGWTVLILSILTSLVFAQLLNRDNSSNANYYVISAAIVLLPISFVTDFFYSKKEPKKKESAAMVVMVIHAVLFALFGIGALIFAVFSFVSLLTSSGSHTSTYVGLWSSIFITIFYAATFIRTINPAKLPWISKAYKIFMLVIILLFILLGFLKPHLGPTGPALQPTGIGGAQCDVSDNYAQVAISGGASCTTAESVIQDATKANGANYKSNGYSCSATKQGSNTQWSSYWSGTFYSYSCADGKNQIAFNWQPASAANNPPSTPSTPTVTIGGPGALQPTLPGDGQCGASTNYAQIAISGGATCTTAEVVAAAANGSNFSSNSYSCSATKEGSNTQWSSYWSGNFYAYTCSNGSNQIAFNWQ